MKEQNKGVLQVHIAVIMFGLVGVIGRFVSTSALGITAMRVLFSSIALFLALKLKKEKILVDTKKDYIIFLIAGAILSFHWVMFLTSVKVGGVAIATITAATFPLFISFFEPVFFKEKLEKSSVIMSIMIIVGVIILTPLDASPNLIKGITTGMLGSFTYAVLALINRKLLNRHIPMIVSFYEQSIVFLITFPIVLLTKTEIYTSDLPLLIFMGIACTALSHTLFISSLKKIKAHTAGIISGLEPVYGIILAIIILGEFPNLRTVVGGLIIILATVYVSLKKE